MVFANMHRLTKRSVSTLLSHGGARYRSSAALVSSSDRFHDSRGDISSSVKWYSVLTAPRFNNGGSAKSMGFDTRGSLNKRFESTAAASDSSDPPADSTAAASDSSDPPAETYEYQAEVSRLMDLIVNSLYSNKEIFLRELISNASDALDKLRFLSVTEPELVKDGADLDIRIQTDFDNGIVTITDSGIGMTRQELVDCLGTIAQSGTAKFLKAIKESKGAGADSNLIGQFGVGFYSAFLVSDRVVVSTKSPKSDKQYIWEAEANSSSYTIREETESEKLLPRGTRLTLYLKPEDKEFAKPEKVEKLVKNYSQFVSFPIYTWQEKEVEVEKVPAEAKNDEQDPDVENKKKPKKVVERHWDWELTNETQPIWLRTPKEVTTREYNEFYRKAFNESLDPLASLHFATEGDVEFRSILYVPPRTRSGLDDVANQKTKNIKLYVKRVFISDDFDGELFPRYLSFVKGVVDSSDLPLNVSREILQESRIVRIMRKQLVRKAFEMIRGISSSTNKEDYKMFWEDFGMHLKIGCLEDNGSRKNIAPLLRFFSSRSKSDMISLDSYVENMKPDQKDIYYISSDSVESASSTPFLEKLQEKDLEVLFLVDPIDEVAVNNLKSYKEKDFVDICKADFDLGDTNEEKEKEMKQNFEQTCNWIKKRLGDKVASVKISNRLSKTPCVISTGLFGLSPNMERLHKERGTHDVQYEFSKGRRVFEINPEHPVIKTLDEASKNSPDDEEAYKALDLLYYAATVSSGYIPENPAEAAKNIYQIMEMAFAGKWASKTTTGSDFQQPQILEAEVVEPSEVDNSQVNNYK